MAKQNLGMVTAYAYAVVGGYEGTEAEFEALLGNIATDLAEIENLTVIANTLPPGSPATASYDHGVLTLGIPKGDKGDTGAGATVTAGTTTTGNPGTNASVTNSGTTKDAVFNFTIPRGDTGNGIESIYLTGTSGAIKTYTILFTDGNTTTFDVTDGEVTLAELASVLPTDTASGAIASFEDGSDLFDYLSCVVEINPVQAGSGTPSPDNVRPITGWTGCEVDVAGKNLFNPNSTSKEWVNTNNQITTAPDCKSNRIKVNAGEKITLSNSNSASATNILLIACCDANENVLSRNAASASGVYKVTATAPANTAFAICAFYTWSASANRQVEYGGTQTDYEAYAGATYPVSWQTEAGTVYGGTVDLVTGVLTVETTTFNCATASWQTRQTGSVNKLLSVSMGTGNYKVADPSIIGEQGEYIQATRPSLIDNVDTWDVGYYSYSSGTQDDSLYFILPLDATPTGKVVYKLATPQTYQLDPVQVACLLGQNNVWADCGDIEEVKYKADVQKWVEKQLREINTAILALS